MNTGLVIWIGIFATIAISIICTTIKEILIAKSRDEREMYISKFQKR